MKTDSDILSSKLHETNGHYCHYCKRSLNDKIKIFSTIVISFYCKNPTCMYSRYLISKEDWVLFWYSIITRRTRQDDTVTEYVRTNFLRSLTTIQPNFEPILSSMSICKSGQDEISRVWTAPTVSREMTALPDIYLICKLTILKQHMAKRLLIIIFYQTFR